MAKFVEIHIYEGPILINLDKVLLLEKSKSSNGTKIHMRGADLYASESYDEMKRLIGAAQGGIPMEPGRMYDGA